MHSIKHILLFTKNNLMQLRRKWISLPLLFIFPIILIGLTVIIMISIFAPDENEPVRIGLVNHDGSEETALVAQLVEESTSLSSYIQIQEITEDEAIKAIEQNEISSYIVFPKFFTTDLYQGNSVEIPIIGNPNSRTESYIINELIESVARHIRASQANILTINEYLKEMNIDDQTRNDLVFEQFKEFVFYTLGREQMISEQEITNDATSSPVSYFAIAGWFIILTLWLLILYHFLSKENTFRMSQRMKLYSVTELQQIISKIIVVLITSGIFAFGLFFILEHFLWEISTNNYVRIFTISLLYSTVYLQSLAVLELLVKSGKLRLLIQSALTFMLLTFSGAIIPIIYFPLVVQKISSLLFSFEGFHWLTEIILHNRFYADYLSLILMNFIFTSILLAISYWKERQEP